MWIRAGCPVSSRSHSLAIKWGNHICLKSFGTIHSHIYRNIIQLIHEVKSRGRSGATAKRIRRSRDLLLEDNNFFSPIFTSLKHCTMKKENLAFLLPHLFSRFNSTSCYLVDSLALGYTWMSVTERPLCTSLSRVVLNTTKFSFLLLLTSSPVLLNMRINVCLKITPNLRWSSTRLWNGTQLFSGTLLNSKVTMLPTKKSDSKRLFMEQMGN